MELGVSARFFLRAGAGGFFSVVDVPVIISDKLPQSIVYENVEVPQIQFIVTVLDIPVATQRRFTHSANCPEDRRVPTGAVLGQGGRRPLLYNDRCLGLTELKTVEVPQLQYSDKVVDVPVCAVHRRLWTSL